MGISLAYWNRSEMFTNSLIFYLFIELLSLRKCTYRWQRRIRGRASRIGKIGSPPVRVFFKGRPIVLKSAVMVLKHSAVYLIRQNYGFTIEPPKYIRYTRSYSGYPVLIHVRQVQKGPKYIFTCTRGPEPTRDAHKRAPQAKRASRTGPLSLFGCRSDPTSVAVPVRGTPAPTQTPVKLQHKYPIAVVLFAHPVIFFAYPVILFAHTLSYSLHSLSYFFAYPIILFAHPVILCTPCPSPCQLFTFRLEVRYARRSLFDFDRE